MVRLDYDGWIICKGLVAQEATCTVEEGRE